MTAQLHRAQILNPYLKKHAWLHLGCLEALGLRKTFVTLHSSGIKGHANSLERARTSFLDTPLPQRLTSRANAWKTPQDTNRAADFGRRGGARLSIAPQDSFG